MRLPVSPQTHVIPLEVSQTSALSQYDISFIWPFQIDAHIFEPQGISMLDAEASFITNDLLGSALTKSFSGKKGHVSFKPSLDQQRSCPTCTDSLLNGDFTIVYDVNRESPGNVQVEVNGSTRLAC